MHLCLLFFFPPTLLVASPKTEKIMIQHTNTEQALLPFIFPLSWGLVTHHAEDTLVSISFDNFSCLGN